MSSILVALDFSDSSQKVLDAAIQVAKGRSGQIVLLHVVAPDPDFVTFDPGPQHERDWRAQHIKEQRAHMEELRDDLRGRDDLSTDEIEVKTVVAEGGTTDKIIEEAGRFSADFIVMGTHGHSAVYEALVGSVAHSVLRYATIPVLLVPVRE